MSDFLLIGAALLFGWLPGVQSPDLASFMGADFAPSGFAGIAMASVSKARALWVAVLASVAFGVVTVVLELAFPEKVLPVLLNSAGSMCLLAWTYALETY
ncbi:hypothetical protein [Pseudarthrobacter polychromogenes]|uniref:Uncharacterized protein n=1 Tax=Pseudarthrobacter polychromogenes TaxID=1676 RepID=A0ABQ1Y2M0_9MICC|nr:hypothetical protein [Pseudarthrobacter polychromogenes]GGH10594.1 hypothetical protein GCM10011577_39470 [Pseudarthrobacter polychromogenes]